MKLSVVIATKDRAAYLGRALDSLAAQRDAPAFEAIVVDNGSRDATPEVVRAHAAAGRFPVHGVHVPRPNRGAARNAGLRRATAPIVVFVDDDVWLPPQFLAAHHAAHAGLFPAAVSGPILNVPSYDARPRPSAANYSRAFLCTCNVSVPRASLEAVGGFDEDFDLYGWEDTELGLRLRKHDVTRIFDWNAFLYHIKAPGDETLAVVLRKRIELARMAARLLRKDSGLRVKLATGAYAANLWGTRLLAPRWSLPWYAGLATSSEAPAAVRALARAQLLGGAYASELRAVLAEQAD